MFDSQSYGRHNLVSRDVETAELGMGTTKDAKDTKYEVDV